MYLDVKVVWALMMDSVTYHPQIQDPWKEGWGIVANIEQKLCGQPIL